MIYLDNAASTRPFDEVVEVMVQVMRDAFANPASAHPPGAAARRRIDAARAQLMAAIGAKDGEIVWTGCGSESDAIGLVGAARARPGKAIVTTALEHDAVLRSAELLGAPLTVVPATAAGVIDVERLIEAVTPDTGVVAVMQVQNEIGTIQPVAEIARAVRARAPGAHIHCDAVQALGKIAVDVHALGVDSAAFVAHKLHGPKGVGAVWLAPHVKLEALWGGGGQQGGRRSGTQDAPGAAGFGVAAERCTRHLADAQARWDRCAETLRAAAAPFEHKILGESRAPNILPLAFRGVPAAALRNSLASRGVAVSAGSACAERDAKPSRVLAALGLPPDWGVVRFSFGHDTSEADVATAAEVLAEVVRGLT